MSYNPISGTCFSLFQMYLAFPLVAHPKSETVYEPQWVKSAAPIWELPFFPISKWTEKFRAHLKDHTRIRESQKESTGLLQSSAALLTKTSNRVESKMNPMNWMDPWGIYGCQASRAECRPEICRPSNESIIKMELTSMLGFFLKSNYRFPQVCLKYTLKLTIHIIRIVISNCTLPITSISGKFKR